MALPPPLQRLDTWLSSLPQQLLNWTQQLLDSLWTFPAWQWLLFGLLLTSLPLIGRRLQKLNLREQALWLPPLRLTGKLLWTLIALFFFLAAAATIILTVNLLNVTGWDKGWAWLKQAAQAFWPRSWIYLSYGALAGLVLGSLGWWAIARHLEPRLNRLLGRRTLSGGRHDGLTDIREVARQLPKPKTYDPRRYFRDSQIFLGLDEHKKPVTIPRRQWLTSHVQILGPPGAGKGIVATQVLAQSIAQGDAVYVMDPKDDEWAPSVLSTACQAAGKPFYLLNLQADQPPQCNLLQGVTPTELTELLVAGFSLADSGSESDHYRRRDRKLARQVAELVEEQSLSVPELYRAILERYPDLQTEAEGFVLHLDELASLTPLATREGIALGAVLDEGGCLYIIGSTRDPATIKAQKMILIRILQLLERRDRRQRQRHTSLFLDEFKYLLSAPSVNALGTVRDKGCNILLAHQSLGDLEDCGEDLRPESVRTSVLDNTPLKWCYQAKDATTAQWISDLSGEIVIDTERRFVERNEALAETLHQQRQLEQATRNLIDPNMVRMLPDRCAVVVGVGQTRLAYTAPYPAQKQALQPVAATPLQPAQQPQTPEDLITPDTQPPDAPENLI